jgi:hypothetical protein
MRKIIGCLSSIVLLMSVTPAGVVARGASSDKPYLRDRGPGVPLSMFGTFIEKGQFVFYPYVELYVDSDAEYSPSELGYGLDRDFRGEYFAEEYLIFFGYGFTRSLALELEAAVISAEQEKAADDPTMMPSEVSESGLGDVESQIRWMWHRETASRPALFSYGEVVFPFQKKKRLIGTHDWEFKVGTGVMKGFGWGTTTLRAALEYNREESALEIGEIAVEYVKRFSSFLRVYAGVEGTQDEWELITEAQLRFSDHAFLKLNNAFGITSKATDWAPETGVVFTF